MRKTYGFFFLALTLAILSTVKVAAQNPYTNGTISTYAGSGPQTWYGYAAGDNCFVVYYSIFPAIQDPAGIFVDSSDNVWFADTYNSVIDVGGPGGVGVFVGTGTAGYSGDGFGWGGAQLSYPSGVAIDGSGNVFIADTGNNAIRVMLQAQGNAIFTYAGTGIAGFSGDGGPAPRAQLNGPNAIGVDTAGNIYISDNNRIRKIVATTGIINTVAGNGNFGFSGDGGPATNAAFNGISSVFVDMYGAIYISDTGNLRIRKVDPITGVINTVAGNGNTGYYGDNGPAISAGFDVPLGVTVDQQGNIFIADSVLYSLGNQRIRMVNPEGIITTVAGNGTTGAGLGSPPDCYGHAGDSGDGGPALAAQLSTPYGVAIDTQGNLYFSEYVWATVRKVTFPFPPVGSLPAADPPEFSLASGAYDEAQYVALSDATPGAAIFYTLDGSMPNFDSPRYKYPIEVTWKANLNAMAIAQGYENSVVNSASYSVNLPAASPSFSPAPGAWAREQYVKLYDATPNAVIYYTTNGSDPDPSASPVYQAPIPIAFNTTVKAIALAPDYSVSKVAAGTYNIPGSSASPPSFSPTPAKYVGAVSVSIFDGTPGATIHFTVDGSAPTAFSPIYSSPFTVTGSITVKAIATAGGHWKSAVAEAQYSVIQEAPTPVISPISGYYPTGQLITITDADPTATIRYTTDGTPPTPTSHFYSKPFALAGPETVKAIVIATGDAESTVASTTYTAPGTITTVAGTGAPGYSGDGGLATGAQLNSPFCPALDSKGNLYIADFGNNVIRKVTPGGVISTYAGTGVAGYSGDEGQAAQAQLNGPTCIAIDSADNLFIADYNDRVIRKVTPNGVIATFAGTGQVFAYGDVVGYGPGGPAVETELYNPDDVAADDSGNVYIADTDQGGLVSKVNAAGAYSPFLGGFPNGGQDQFSLFVATDHSGDVFITNTDDNVVYEIYANGASVAVAGNGYFIEDWGAEYYGFQGGYSGDGGPATSAELDRPAKVLVDPRGNLFIGDTLNNRVRRVDPSGTIITYAGNGNAAYSGDNGPSTNASLNSPWGMAIDSAGSLYIADSQNNVIRKVTPASAQ